MGAPPPSGSACDISVAASAGMISAPIPTGSLCGFKFPTFTLPSIGIKIPTLPNFNLSLFLPFLSLRCSLEDPIGAGWGGGRLPVLSPCASDENQND